MKIGKLRPPTKEENTMEQLRRLDASATKGASIVSLIIEIVGIASVIAAYPIYTHMVGRKRAKQAPEILCLSDELMK